MNILNKIKKNINDKSKIGLAADVITLKELFVL